MKKFLLGLTGLVIFLIAIGCYLLLFTSLPLMPIQALLNGVGIGTQGMSGSLSSGIHIDAIKAGEANNVLELENFNLKYSGLWDLYIKRELNISEITLDKLRIKISSKDETNKTKTHSNKQLNISRSNQATDSVSGLRHIKINKINISNLVFDLSNLGDPFTVENCEILELVWHQDNKIDFKKFSIASNALNLDLSPPTGPDSKNMRTDLTGTLKPAYFKWIKQPLSFSSQIILKDGSLDRSKFYFWLLDKKVDVKFNDAGLLSLKVENLNLQEFFTSAPPIDHINLTINHGPNLADLKAIKVIDGDFMIGPNKFIIIPNAMVTAIDDEKDSFTSEITAETLVSKSKIQHKFIVSLESPTNAEGKKENAKIQNKLELRAQPSLEKKEILSRLLFNKSFNLLGSDQKIQLEQVANFYIDASITTPDTKQFVSNRVPANMSGDWKMVANKSYQFVLRLNQTGDAINGTMTRTNGSEPVTQVSGKILKDGSVEFVRGVHNQHYKGAFQATGNKLEMRGLFNDRWEWSAIK